MNEKKKEDMLRKRDERFGQVIRPAENVQRPAIPPDTTEEVKPKAWMTRQSYHIQLNAEDIEFVERYTYWRKVALGGRKWTISDTLTDALRMLAKHTQIDVKPIPDWVPKRKRKKQQRNDDQVKD